MFSSLDIWPLSKKKKIFTLRKIKVLRNIVVVMCANNIKKAIDQSNQRSNLIF